MHPPESLPRELLSSRMIARAIVKALCLFFVFNLMYGLIKPVQHGMLPSLYNVVFPGRVRFMKDYEFDAYRLVSDHVIDVARSDTFNIVVLGSSEMWGTRSVPDLSVPVILDRLNLVAADGRPVRVYNLAHPVPYGLKDLVLMEAVLRLEIPVDLVILSTVDTTLGYYYFYQPIASANFDLMIDVIDHYRLTGAYKSMDGSRIGRSTPVMFQLWEDRSALQGWIQMQMRALNWSVTRLDLSNVSEDHLTNIGQLDGLYTTLTLDHFNSPPTTDFLYAFKQMSLERNLPVIILASPVPYLESEFVPWLHTQIGIVGLPLLDCWNVFRDPRSFEDIYHIRPEMHGPFARILAAHLSDPRMAAESPGLPLQLPPDFITPPESCAFYPVKPAA